MAKLFIVRHAQVTIDFRIPPSQWRISDEGLSATRELAANECWGEVRHIYHSPELKAAGTARIISDMTGIPTTVMEDLPELSIPTIRPTEEFIRRVGAYLSGFNDPEFENWNTAKNRIVGCVRRVVSDANGDGVAVVSHGRILTVLFSHLFQRRMTVAEWQSIRLPDLAVVDLDTWTVERGFFSNISV